MQIVIIIVDWQPIQIVSSLSRGGAFSFFHHISFILFFFSLLFSHFLPLCLPFFFFSLLSISSFPSFTFSYFPLDFPLSSCLGRSFSRPSYHVADHRWILSSPFCSCGVGTDRTAGARGMPCHGSEPSFLFLFFSFLFYLLEQTTTCQIGFCRSILILSSLSHKI